MDILERIVETKKREVAEAKRKVPEARLRAQALEPRSGRPFMQALTQPGPFGINVIAEIKRASPSKGPIRLDLDPAALAGLYEKAGAAALSVLTDRPFFRGGPEDLKAARQAVRLPVLRKDFLVSAYQIYESAVMGADAVLLIARILSPERLKTYLALAESVHLDALVEVHSETDIQSACAAGATLIGINNRNLTTFQTDLRTTCRLVDRLAPHQIAVAESGIRNREDIDRLMAAGVRNFLIGESLVRSEDPAALLDDLMGNKETLK